jgi:hypothetical protein
MDSEMGLNTCPGARNALWGAEEMCRGASNVSQSAHRVAGRAGSWTKTLGPVGVWPWGLTPRKVQFFYALQLYHFLLACRHNG